MHDSHHIHEPAPDSVIGAVYRRLVRPLLPRQRCELNGVTVIGPARLFESQTTYPEYKQCMCSFIRDHVEAGDDVTVVGGGFGVLSVACARQGAQVETYEASADSYADLTTTLSLNDCHDAVSVYSAVVGRYDEHDQEKYGFAKTTPRLSPGDVCTGDVLVLDCEGAEEQILSAMKPRPDRILVEYHGFVGVPRDAVEDLLTGMGYEVVDQCMHPANERLGVGVIYAEREE